MSTGNHTRREFLKSAAIGGSGLALGASTLGGRRPVAYGAGKDKIVVLDVYAEWANVYEEIIREFRKAEPGIEVVHQKVGWDQAHEKLILRIAGKDAPSCSGVPDFWYSELVHMKALVDLEERIAKWGREGQFLDWVMRRMRAIDGKAYGLPNFSLVTGLYYRHDYFDEAGIPHPPKTWDDMLQAAIKLTDPKKGRVGFAMRGGRGGERYWLGFMLMANGGKWFDDEGNCLLNQSGGPDGLEWFANLYKKHRVTQTSAPTDGSAGMRNAFASGSAAMYIHDSSSVVLQTEKLGRDKFRIAPVPVGPKGIRQAQAGAYYFSVYGQADDQESAWKFTRFVSENDLWCQKAGDFPANKHFFERPWFKSYPQWSTFSEIIQDTQGLYFPPDWVPEWGGLVETVFTPLFQRVLAGSMSAKDAADNIAASLTKAQKKYLAARKPK